MIRTGRSSSRPASISKIRIIFEKQLYREKFPVGPTTENPGPILFNVAATADMFVSKSKPSTEISRIDSPKIRK